MSSLPRIPAELWPQVSALFDQVQALPTDQQAAWLAALDASSAELAQHLRVLLAAHAHSDPLSPPDGDLLAQALGAHVQTLAAGTMIGVYRLLEPLGRGGMATVWAAEQTQGVMRRVALKLPHPGLEAPAAMAARFERERDLLAGLEHPHIGRLYDAGVTAQGQPFLAMELIAGVSITQHALQQTVRERLLTFLQVLDAVCFAHGRLVIHRDIKPSNILVTPEGQVKLLDFGIARLLSDAEVASGPLSGSAFTPDCASPEQLSGQPLGAASDVYSLGVVLFELLCGQRPYTLDRHATPTLTQQLQSATPLRATPERDLNAIVARAMAYDVAQRYPSAEALDADIRCWLDGLPVQAREGGKRYRSGLFVRRHRVALAAGSAAVLALLVGLGTALWQAREARAQAARAAAVQGLLIGFFEGVNPDQQRGKVLSARELVTQGSDRAELTLKDQPELRAELLRVSGKLLMLLTQSDAAAKRLTAALALIEQQEGPGTWRAIETRFNLVEALKAGAEPQRARSEGLTVLRLGEKYFGSNHPWAMRMGIQLADAELLLGEPQKAMDAVRAALALPAPPGVNVPELSLIGQSTVAEAYIDLGQYAKARETYEAILAQAPSVPSYSATNLLRARYGLMSASGYAAEFARLVELGQPLLADIEAAMGPASNMALRTRETLAQGLARLGRFAESVALQRGVVRAYEAGPERDGENAHHSRAILALLLGATGRGEEALPLARAAVTFFDATYPKTNAQRENRRYWLALVLLRSGQLQEAADVLAQTLVHIRSWPDFEKHRRYAEVLLAQAMVHYRLKRPMPSGEPVLPALEKACTLIGQSPGSASGPGLRCNVHLAFVRGMLYLTPAIGDFDTTAQAYLDSLPNGHVVGAEVHLLRAELLAAAGRKAQAAVERQLGLAAWQQAIGLPFKGPVIALH